MPSKVKPASILVVDDELIIRETLVEFLQSEALDVIACATGEEAVKLASQRKFDVVLCDLHLPGWDGIEVLERILRLNPETCVMLVTAYATVETAIEAFQKGVHDYLMKPVILHEVLEKIHRLLHHREIQTENVQLRRELHRAESGEMVMGRSPAMRQVLAHARKVAPTPSTVLILGESGTGKELLARAIHSFSQTAKPTNGRFLAVNCAAIPHDLLENQLFGHRKGAFTGADRDAEGVFAHAGSGTVFLDEIGELPLATQAKLLRAIEQKEIFPVGANEPVQIQARILAATNRDLSQEIEAGRFREDLFYRLNVVSILLPALRERREDIPELVDFLLHKHALAMSKPFTGVSHEAMRLLLNYPWKGNIRELDNTLQRAVIFGDGPLVEPGDLPNEVAPSATDPFAIDDLNAAVERFEKLHIERMLRVCADKKEAARRLGIGLSSLYRKIEQCGIGDLSAIE